MLKEAIKEAATIEEAKAAAARELGVPEEKAQFEGLQAPQKKTLGLFGGCPARRGRDGKRSGRSGNARRRGKETTQRPAHH